MVVMVVLVEVVDNGVDSCSDNCNGSNGSVLWWWVGGIKGRDDCSNGVCDDSDGGRGGNEPSASGGIGDRVNSESALTSAGTLLRLVHAPPSVLWPDGWCESPRSLCYDWLYTKTDQLQLPAKFDTNEVSCFRDACADQYKGKDPFASPCLIFPFLACKNIASDQRGRKTN
ncbi:hypothetical protein PoB_005690000 [Plakobranchus ocellatus]|uniref:Uncharacterized protein n=1 Tax=Plakobranchus ocellatus TaxID=259542 RepID=A0AAV4CFA0_9GAST|nr:hypothetical protein PoB_005690000 [Plakobranchus ocellatus]